MRRAGWCLTRTHRWEETSFHQTGLLVGPDDPAALARALRGLADDDGLRLRLGEQAARVAREFFDLDRYVDRLEAYYARGPRSH